MQRVWTLATKDLKILLRDKAAVFWVLGFPLVMGVLFGSIFGGDSSGGMSPTKIAVIDQDGSTESKALIGRLKKSAAIKVSDMDLTAAKTAVRKGDLTAYLLVPKGFGEADKKFQGGTAPLKVGTDPSRKAEAGMLQGVISEAAFGGMQEKFSNPAAMQSSAKQSLADLDKATDMDPAEKAKLSDFLKALDKYGSAGSTSGKGSAAMQPPKIEIEPVSAEGVSPASAFEVSFPQALLWGLLAVVATFAVSMVQEREKGTLVRLRVSPMSFGEVLGGKGLACFLSCIGVMTLLLIVGKILFHIRLGSPVLVAIAVLASAICFVGVMMLLSVLGRTEQAVAGSSWGVLIMMAMFGGGMVPLFIMPGWMQAVSNISPMKWSITAVEGAIWRGYSLQEMLVPVAVLVGVGVVCFGIGVRVLARAKD